MQEKPHSHPLPKLDDLFARSRRGVFFTPLDWLQLFLCGLIIALHLVILKTGSLERFENIVLDYFFRQRPPLSADPRIALIEIDPESVQAIGSWPWPWSYHGEMVNALGEWGAKAALFDFAFSEPPVPYEDAVLEEALKKNPYVYLPVTLGPKTVKKIWVHSLPIALEPEGKKKIWSHSAPSLEQHARAVGHINLNPDTDGVVRRIPPSLTYEGESHPHLAIQAAFDISENPETVKAANLLPLDNQGNLLINWAGKWRDQFEHYSYADLIRSFQALGQGQRPVLDPAMLKDKICVIGLSAPGLADSIVTPLESVYPALGIQANVLNSILTKRFVIPVSFRMNALILLAIGLGASLLFVIFRNVMSFVAGLALGGIWLILAFFLFAKQGIWLTVAHPLLLILILFIFSALYDHFIARRERLRLFDLATRDGLTGLYVIRHFREILNQVVQEAQRKREPLSLILLDIDNFKAINDNYGHQVGDKILKETADVIFSCFRSRRPIQEADFVARYGGEEFIVMLRNTTLQDGSRKIAERIRRTVEEHPFHWHGNPIAVTVSLGVAALHAGELVPDAMVRRADEALYKAKREGKNRVSDEDAASG